MEIVYPFVRTVTVVPMRHAMRWTIEGAHRIPVRGPVILASNHTSYLDPFALANVGDQRHRRLRFLAKAELFDKRGLSFLLRHGRQIPVKRETHDAAGSLDAAAEALRRGECIAVFPEGTISLDLEPMGAKTGAARLAEQTGVPVTPVGLWGAHRVLFKHRKPKWRGGVAEVAVVGEPVRVGAHEDVHVATERIMTAIATCVARARELYPQRPASGEDDWWVRRPETVMVHRAQATEAGEA